MSTEPFSDKFDDNGELKNRQIGRYILQDRLGSGGTATVYQAYDQVNGQSVALKVLPSTADEKTLERFRREAMTSGGLRHPHIVRTIQVGVASHAGDIAYIAMELIDGESLSQLLTKRGRLHPEESCSLLAPIASALAYAHDEGIVHRDVKPSNILLKPSRPSNPDSVQLDSVDNPLVPMLSDFGIARALDAPDLTASGRTVGTPAYMAPEQCRGGQNIDGRADIYALTAVLFRCLVGRQPFLGNTPQILHAHVYEPLKIEDDIYRRLSPLVVEILQNGMAKRPHDRYSNAYELAEALASAAGITLASEAITTDNVILPTITLPSIEALDEPPTISETVIIPSSATVPSTSEVSIPTPSSLTQRGQEQSSASASSTELPLNRSQSRAQSRQIISPPTSTTQTTSSVQMFERTAEPLVARSITFGERLERIRWGWVAFASVGLLLLAGLSGLIFGTYRGPGRLGNLFGGTSVVPTATSININAVDNDNQTDNIPDGSNDSSTVVPIISPPDGTYIVRITAEAVLTNAAQSAVTLTATVDTTSVATASVATASVATAPVATDTSPLQPTIKGSQTPPRFIPATTSLTTIVTLQPSTATPIPPAISTLVPATLPAPTPTTMIAATPTITPTATPTITPTPTPTLTPLNATATWTPVPVFVETVETNTPVPTDTVLPTEVPTSTETPTPTPVNIPDEAEPLTAPTPTWTPPASTLASTARRN